MGLFDSFNPNFASSPQFQKGLLMMAMASGNPRTSANAAGLLQMQQQEEDAKFKRGLLSMEMQQKQAQLDKANKLQAAMGGLFGGSQTAPSQQDMQRVGMESGDGFTGHASPQAISTATQMAQPRKSGLAGATIDQIAAIQGMGGPNLLDAWKLAQTGVKQDAGAYYKDANGNLQYLPTVDKGIGVMNGVATALPGYAQANAGIQGLQTQAQEAAKLPFDLARFQGQSKANADWTPQEVYSPTGEKIVRPRSAVLAPGASAPESAIRGQATGDMGGTLAQYKADIADIDKALQTPGLSKQDRQLLQGQRDMRVSQISRYFGDQQASAKPDQTSGAGNVVDLSPQQQAQNEANRTLNIERAKNTAEAEKNAPTLEKRKQGAIEQANRMVMKVDQALSLVGNFTAGPGSYLDGIPGSSAKNLKSDIETLKANLGFAELQAMREASPTGGALGAVSERELTALQSAVASLDNTQSADQLRRNLNEVKKRYQNMTNLIGGSAPGGATSSWDQSSAKPAKTVVRTGMYGGRKVVQYSDGTTDYAD